MIRVNAPSAAPLWAQGLVRRSVRQPAATQQPALCSVRASARSVAL
jgi:hypothetical protein